MYEFVHKDGILVQPNLTWCNVESHSMTYSLLVFTLRPIKGYKILMEQCALKYVNNYLNTNIYPHLETSGGQSSNLYLNVINSINTSVNQTSVAA